MFRRYFELAKGNRDPFCQNKADKAYKKCHFRLFMFREDFSWAMEYCYKEKTDVYEKCMKSPTKKSSSLG